MCFRGLGGRARLYHKKKKMTFVFNAKFKTFVAGKKMVIPIDTRKARRQSPQGNGQHKRFTMRKKSDVRGIEIPPKGD